MKSIRSSSTNGGYSAINETSDPNGDKNHVNENGESVDYEKKSAFVLLLPLAFICFIDALSFMAVAPSLVFYVRDVMGGTKEQYGTILSIFSFASFLGKPFLGYWCDASGKFRTPYFVSLLASAVGGLVYFIASVFAHTNSTGVSSTESTGADTGSSIVSTSTIGLALVFLGRLLGGLGAANSTLGFTYIALVLKNSEMTKASSILTTTRIIGMALGPMLSVFLNQVSGSITIGTTKIELDHLNCVGLVLFAGNLLALLVMYVTFSDPPSKTISEGGVDGKVDVKSWSFWRLVLSLEILIPIYMIFVLNANFQLIETALAPAANHALDWGPTQVGAVFSFNAILMFGVILATYMMASRGVSDFIFLYTGQTISVIGYTTMYLLWKADAKVWEFVLPAVLSVAAFPFLGAPTRSVFTELVSNQPSLRNHQGTMQALMSMSASVAGFVAPGLIATYILRSPDDVDSSTDQREFSPFALGAPFLSSISLLGCMYLRYKHDQHISDDNIGYDAVPAIDEVEEAIHPQTENGDQKCLLRTNSTDAGDLIVPRHFHPLTIACRKEYTSLMGIHQISFMEHQANQYPICTNKARSSTKRQRSDVRSSARF